MITSVKNEKVKHWQKLKMKKERMKTETFLIEGYHLIEEAWKSDWDIEEIILEETADSIEVAERVDTYRVSDNVFKAISETKTPQGIAAVVRMKASEWSRYSQILLLDAIQDPGNLGTIIRTADAAGFDAVVLGNGTVDLYNDKVIRATQGSIFHLPVFQEELVERIPVLKEEGFTVWAAALQDSVSYKELKRPERTALLVGNEGAGIGKELLEIADQRVQIPIYGKAESLNVSVATGIMLYHLKA